MKKLTILFAIQFFTSFLLIVYEGKAFSQNITITTDSVIQTSPCAGSNIYIPFTVSGGPLSFTNVFTAELSDPIGSFSSPTNIGTLPYWNSALIVATIPINTTFGLYKVRVIASHPAITGTISPNSILVAHIAQLATVSIQPKDTICEGDSVTLKAVVPGQTYSWSTGETTRSINVHQSGVYTLTLTDNLGCQTNSDPQRITVETCTGIYNNGNINSLTIFPIPGNERITIEMYLLNSVPSKIILRNITGNILFISENKLSIGQYGQQIDISTFAEGIYFLEINIGEEKIVRKVIKN